MNSIQNSPFSNITIQLPLELQRQVYEVANQQDETFSEMIRMALEFYLQIDFKPELTKQRKISLKQARHLMREFGKGLGKGSSPHNTARNHDAYLYQ